MSIMILAILLSIFSLIAAQEAPDIIDLSHTYTDEVMGKWPDSTQFRLTQRNPGPIAGAPGAWVATNDFTVSEHGGTHIDAPYHTWKDGITAEKIPFRTLHGPAVVIDIKHKAALSADAVATVEDITAWERTHGQIPPRALVFVNSGWAQHYMNQTAYVGFPDVPADFTNKMHFPGPDEQFARWLVANRDINGIGVDTPSCDYGQTKTYDSHYILPRHNKICIENVNNLDELPPTGYRAFAPLLKILNGTAAPVRLFAKAGASAVHGSIIPVSVAILVIALARSA